MANEAALQARIDELERKHEILIGVIGRTSGSFNTLGPAIDKALGPFSALISATSSGATGMSAYNASLDKVAESAADLTKNFPILGSAINAMAGVGMEYVKAVNTQNDELYKSYQGLSRIGLAGEANTDSLLKMAQQFGVVNDKQLPQFTQMLSANSETLAKFGGTAAQGVKAFGDISENIQRTGVQTQLLNMGMSIESINAGTAGYIKQQTMSGAAMQRAGEDQKAYTTRMAVGAEDYIKQMDTLSKLTGKSSEALEKDREAALLSEQYSLHERELQQKIQRGGEEGLAAEKQLAEERKIIAQTEGSVQKGFLAAFTGMGMQFEEGRKLYQSAPEAFNQAAKGTGIEANSIMDSAKSEFKKTMDTFGSLIMATGNTLFANVNDMRKLENLQGTAEERTAAALAQQNKQIVNTDESIKAQTATLQLQRDAQKDLQNMIHAGSAATSYFMLKLAEAVKAEGTSRLPGAAGTQGMDPAQKAAEQAKAQIQMRSQGVGGTRDEEEDVRRSAQKDVAGKVLEAPTEAMIYAKAVKEMAEFVPALKAATEKAIADAGKLAGNATSDVVEATRNALRDTIRGMIGLPENRPNPLPQPISTPRGFSENLQELGASKNQAVPSAAKNQAGPSVASMQYKQSVNPDVAQQLSGPIDDAKRAMTQFAGLPEKTSNEELIASNVLLEKKMDELIDISRASRSYLEKISNQAYA